MSDALKGQLAVNLLKFLALLPLSCLRALGFIAGKCSWLSHSKSRKTSDINIKHCLPELSVEQRDKLVQQSLINSAQAVFEMAAVWLWPQKRNLALIESVENEQLIKNAAASGRGVIVVVPHLGNWEIFSWYFPQVAKITCLYTPPKLAALDQLIKASRCAGGIEVAPTSMKGIAKIVKTLRAGNMTGILPDQEPELEGGVFAPFFNHQALTMTLVSNLARKTNAVVICGYAERTQKGFKVLFDTVDESVYSTDDLISVTAINQAVEDCIKKIPEQYQWEYKRFKRQPNRERADKFYS